MIFVESFRSTLLSWDPIGGDLEGTESGVALDLVVIVLIVADVCVVDTVVVVVGVFFVVVVVVKDTFVVGIDSVVFCSKLNKLISKDMVDWRKDFSSNNPI